MVQLEIEISQPVDAGDPIR